MVSIKRKITISILLILLLSVSVVGYADDFDVKAKSAILIDAETGQVLFNKNENMELPPASITKIMTMLLAMESIEDGELALNDKVEVSSLAESMGGSQVWLESGEKITLEDLLKAIMIPSANDACVAVAEYVGGTESNFVSMMNNKAKELGLEHTQFINTTGLPETNGGHYSSAHDIAVMARELVKHQEIFNWSSKRVDYIRDSEYQIYTTNELLGHFPGADGLKTGWTEKAGYCLAGTAKRGDWRLISVVMKTANQDARVEETAKLLDYGFRAFHQARLINSGVKVAKVEVNKGKELEVPIQTDSEFAAIIKRGTKDDVKQEVKLTRELTAPVNKGEIAGQLVFTQDGKELGSVNLVTTKPVEKAGIVTLILRWIKGFILGFLEK